MLLLLLLLLLLPLVTMFRSSTAMEGTMRENRFDLFNELVRVQVDVLVYLFH